jgi:LSD1 subclass zinc finger protein
VQVWEVVHKGGGYAAVIIAVATLFTAFNALEGGVGGVRRSALHRVSGAADVRCACTEA